MKENGLKSWIDEMFSLEIKNPPHKPKGAINVIVYDNTSVPPPGAFTVGDKVKLLFNDPATTLTFWWKIGAFIDQLQFFADYTVAAANWDQALRGVLQAVDDKTKRQGSPATVASLQFWGHGAPGRSFMGNDSLDKASLTPGGAHADLVAQVAAKMHPTEASVWFRQCNTFMGADGQEFARAASRAFGRTVVGHTFIIHAWQSGTEFLLTGQQPDWDDGEGTKKHGKNKGKPLVSDPLRHRTVNMFRLYPPLERGEFIIPPTILAPMRRALSRLAADE